MTSYQSAAGQIDADWVNDYTGQTSRLSSAILSPHKHGATNEDSYRSRSNISALSGLERLSGGYRQTTRGSFDPTTVKIPSLESRETLPAASTAATHALVVVNMSNKAVRGASVYGYGADDIVVNIICTYKMRNSYAKNT